MCPTCVQPIQLDWHPGSRSTAIFSTQSALAARKGCLSLPSRTTRKGARFVPVLCGKRHGGLPDLHTFHLTQHTFGNIRVRRTSGRFKLRPASPTIAATVSLLWRNPCCWRMRYDGRQHSKNLDRAPRGQGLSHASGCRGDLERKARHALGSSASSMDHCSNSSLQCRPSLARSDPFAGCGGVLVDGRSEGAPLKPFPFEILPRRNGAP